MIDLDAIIEFEQEHTGLDFKLEEYSKQKKIDLIKDVMSMANANYKGDRFIIIGMKPDSTGRGIVGIPTVSDAAAIQQTIIDNIEPEIHLDYTAYHYGGKILGVLRVHSCDQRPYLMKKDFNADKAGVLKKGEGFFRLGTTQPRLYRAILERIYKERYDMQGFSGELQVSFFKEQQVTELMITAPTITAEMLPSQIKRVRIDKIIAQKEKELKQLHEIGMPFDENYLSMASMNALSMANLHGGGVSYEDRSLKMLRKNLEDVTTTYYRHDSYFLLEENSEKLTLYVKNLGNQYLQGVKMVMRITKREGLLVAKKLPTDPDDDSPNISRHYPHVEENDSHYEISRELGDLKQQLVTKIFEEPFRLCVLPKFSDPVIGLQLFFYAKNLSAPIEKQLQLRVS